MNPSERVFDAVGWHDSLQPETNSSRTKVFPPSQEISWSDVERQSLRPVASSRSAHRRPHPSLAQISAFRGPGVQPTLVKKVDCHLSPEVRVRRNDHIPLRKRQDRRRCGQWQCSKCAGHERQVAGLIWLSHQRRRSLSKSSTIAITPRTSAVS